MSLDIYGYRGNCIKVFYSNFEEKEAIETEVIEKGAFIMSPHKDDNSYLYITGDQQKIKFSITELNFQTINFEELDIEFTNGEFIEDISLILVSN